MRTIQNAKRVLLDVMSIKNASSFTSSNSKSLGSIDNNKKVEEQLDILDQVEQKLKLASKDSTSLDKKGELYEDIKDLLKGMDDEVIQALFEGFEDIANPPNPDATNIDEGMQTYASFVTSDKEYSQFKKGSFASEFGKELDKLFEKEKKEFEDVFNPKNEISSLNDAKSFLEKTQKNDINVEELSASHKTMYLKNKFDAIKIMEQHEKPNHYLKTKEKEDNNSIIVQAFKNEEHFKIEDKDYDKFNSSLNARFDKVLDIQKEELTSIKDSSKTKDMETVADAKAYLEMADRRKNDISSLTDLEQSVHESKKQKAEKIIEDSEKYKQYESIYKPENLSGNLDSQINYLNEVLNELNERKNQHQKSILDTISHDKQNNALEINYQKDSGSFSKQNISTNTGHLSQTQANNPNQSQVSKLLG